MERYIVTITSGEHVGIWGPFGSRDDATMFAMQRTYGSYEVQPLLNPEVDG